jgi:glycosyltransferase involved in cell wall biosynthesis
MMQRKCEDKSLPFRAIDISSIPNPFSIFRIILLLRSRKYDILHLHTSRGHTLAVIARWLGLRIEMVLSRRVDFPIRDRWFSRYKYNHPGIAKIICVSEFIKKIMEATLGADPRLEVVYSGVDLEDTLSNYTGIREQLGVSSEAIVIGNISALADHKDLFTFIDTAEKVVQKLPRSVFLIVGTGPLKDKLIEYIEKKKLKSHVILTGFIEDVASIYQILDIFLFTSKTEGLGTTVLDAMKNGLPIVATKAGGIPEMITHRETGLLANVGDFHNLAECILNLEKDPEMRRNLGRNAQIRVKDFSIQNTYHKTIRIYEEVLRPAR